MYIKKIREVIILQTRDELMLAELRGMMTENRLAFKDVERRDSENATVSDVKSRFQEICKLLRKQSKDLGDESQRMLECERLKMEDISMKFMETVEDITAKLTEQESLYQEQCKENEVLVEKVGQFEGHELLRNEHFTAQLRAKTLELQLEVAKRDQKQHMLSQERGKGDAYRAHAAQLLGTEKEMKNQLSMYAAKFEHFQDALNRSNAMFAQFKVKMDDMDNTIKRLKAENEALRQTSSESNMALLEQMNQKHAVAKSKDVVAKRKAELEKICRKLQTDRLVLSERLKNSVPTEQAQLP
jgi:archaellum component FlaC